jgi:anoctamin-10/anoctamin-7
LAIPAVIGLFFEIGVAITSNPAYAAIPFFSLFICIWGVFFAEYWKRQEKFTSLEYGMTGFEATEGRIVNNCLLV